MFILTARHVSIFNGAKRTLDKTILVVAAMLVYWGRLAGPNGAPFAEMPAAERHRIFFYSIANIGLLGILLNCLYYRAKAMALLT